MGNNPGTKVVQKLMDTTPITRDEYNESCAKVLGFLGNEILNFSHQKQRLIPTSLLSTSEKDLAARVRSRLCLWSIL